MGQAGGSWLLSCHLGAGGQQGPSFLLISWLTEGSTFWPQFPCLQTEIRRRACSHGSSGDKNLELPLEVASLGLGAALPSAAPSGSCRGQQAGLGAGLGAT